MTVFVKINNGVVVQKQPNPEEGFVEAPDWVICGMLSQDDTYIEQVPSNPPHLGNSPYLYATVSLCVVNGSLTTIELAAQLASAYYEDGWMTVALAQTQADTNYLIFVQTDLPAKVEQFKDLGSFELIFSDPVTGDPIEPGRIDLQLLKVR